MQKAREKGPFFEGLVDGVPIFLGYISVSFVFGMLCRESGLSAFFAGLISASNLTSAGQFAGLSIMLAAGTVFEIILTTLVINIRYTLMSISLSQRVEMNLLQRAIVSFGVTDEIFGVSMQRQEPLRFSYMMGLILLPFIGWVGGTLLGATLTDVLPASVRSAMGIAIYGMFIAIIVPPAKKLRPVLVCCLLAMALSSLFFYVPGLNALSSGWVVIICAVLAAGFTAWRYPLAKEGQET